MAKKPPLILIVGPTGVGKTAASVYVAKSLNAEIISCDSMQIYKYMDIGTAKVTPEEARGIVHHMTDIISPLEKFSVCDYVKLAKEAAKDIYEKGKPAIMVGGTGLYADSFVKDIDYTETETDVNLRASLKEYADRYGCEALHAELKKIDPESADAIHPNNVKRVIRAIEYYRLSGEKISEHNEKTKNKPSPYNYIYIGFTRDRNDLYENINKRVDMMMENGLANEVMKLYKMGCRRSHTSMQAIGYKEMLWYINGKATFDEAVEILKKNSRRYAKRQLTWFNKNKEIHWINLTDVTDSKAAAEKCLKIIKENGVLS